MNRIRPGYNPRLSTPGRSRLNTDDWYNRLYLSTLENYSDLVRQVESQKKEQIKGVDFWNDMMDLSNSKAAEFAEKFAIPSQEILDIPEIEITPNKKEDKSESELEDRRRMLKEKKWFNGMNGDGLTKKEEDELNQLDLWHSLVYNDGYKFLEDNDILNKPKSPQELALELARARLNDLGGAPEGYWSRTAKKITNNLMYGAMGAAGGLAFGPIGALVGAGAGILFAPDPFEGLENDTRTNLIDDISTSFVRKVNEIQVGTSKGKIQRTQEMLLLAQNGMEELLEKILYRDNLLSQINELQAKRQSTGITADEAGLLDKLQKQYNDSYIDELRASDKLDALGSYDPYEALGPLSYVWSKINRALDVDYFKTEDVGKFLAKTIPSLLPATGHVTNFLNRIDFAYDLGIRDDLAGILNDLRRFRQARREGDRYKQNLALESMQLKIAAFDLSAEERKKGWSEDIDFDKKDIERIDSNYKVSEYYNLLDQLALDLGIFSPKKILFSSSGLLGSSMSSTPKSILKLGSYVMAATLPGAGGLAAASATNLISGGAQATDENNAEVGLTYQIYDFINALRNKGVLEETIKDGRKQLGNDKAELDDIIEAFTEGKIMFSDRKVREAMLNIIAGANQQWAYDMNATAPGVWTDAALTIIPDAYYLKASKFARSMAPKRVREMFKNMKGLAHESRIGMDMIPEEELLALESVAAKRGIVDPIIVTMRSAAGKTGSAIANKFQGERFNATVDYLRDKLGVVVLMGKKIPTGFISGPKSAAVKRAAKSFAARSIIGSSEEFWEEDVQSIREHERRKGKFGSEFIYGTYNPRLIWNNFADGIRSSWDFLFKDPALATQEEKEIWREAKLGALGWFLLGGAPAFVQSARGTWKLYNTTDLILQQVLNTKAEDDAQILRGIKFAQRAKNYDDFETAMRAFDDIERYNRKKNADAEQNNDEDTAGFADDSIESNRKLYKQIYALYNNPLVRAALKSAGIEEGSEKYNTAISMIARQQTLANEKDEEVLNVANTINNIKTVLKSDYWFSKYREERGISFNQQTTPEEISTPQGKLGGLKKAVLELKRQQAEEKAKQKDIEDEQNWMLAQRQQYYKYIDDLFYLASIGSLIDQINTYSQLESLTDKKSDFLKNLKAELKAMNKERTDAGYKSLDTPEDVLAYVQDQDMYEMIKDLYRQYDGHKQDRTAMQAILDRMLSPERIVTGEKAEEVYQINNMIDKYNQNMQSDMQLQQMLEDDFFRTVRHKLEIEDFVDNITISNSNNIYTGFDGKSYIVIPKVDRDGNTYYAKYEYDEDEHEAVGSKMPFDKEEFFISKKADERDIEREASADISDEERIDIGNRRKRRESRLMDYAQTHRFSDAEYDNWQYSEGEEQSNSERQLREERAQREARAAEAEERHRKLLEDNPEWSYSEGEDTEDQLATQMQAHDRAMKEREQAEKLAAEREANIAARQEPDDLVHRLYNDGYRFYEGHTKRGKTFYYATKKGEKDVRITKDEYEEGLQLLIQKNREQNLRSNSFFEYDPKFSVHKQGLIAKRDAFAQVEAIILGSIYDNNELRFNDLLDYFGTVLTDQQIDRFRYVWLMINNTVAEERESLASMKDAREARAERIRNIIKQQWMVSDIIRSMESMLFKMHDVYGSISPIQVAEWVSLFTEQRNPKAKGLLRKQLLSSVNGISRATLIVAIAKSNWNVFSRDNKYFAQAPTGEEYDLTEFQYSFYQFVKENIDRKLLEFKPETQDKETPSFEAFMDFINTLAKIKELTPEEVIPDNTEQPITLNGVHFDPMTFNIYLGKQDEKDGRDGIGDFSARGTESPQDEIIAEIKKHSVAGNPKILHELTTAHHYFTLDDRNRIVVHDRVHFAIDLTLGNSSLNINDPLFKKYSEFKAALNKALELALLTEKPRVFFEAILAVQDDRNKKVAEYYDINSAEYKLNAVNFEGYRRWFDDYRLPQIGAYIVEEVAKQAAYDSIFSNRKKYYLRAGNIIDDIARIIFQDKIPVNRPEYKMSDDVFDKFCRIVYRKKHALDSLGIKVITDEILLSGNITNDNYKDSVAGVPDMLAVDKQGNIYLIDFKTTSGLLPYDKSIDSLASVNYRNRMTPAEARKYNRDNLGLSAEFDRAQLALYSKLLAMYSRLIELMFGEAPKKMYIAPIYLKRTFGKNEITGMNDEGTLNEILDAEPFAYFEILPDMSVITVSDYDWSEVDAKMNTINYEYDLLRQDIVKNNSMISGTSLMQWNDIVKRVNNLNLAIKEAKDGEIAPEDTILSELAKLILDILKFKEAAAQDRSNQNQPKQDSVQPPRKGGHTFNAEIRPGTGELETNYNNVDYNLLFTIDRTTGKITWKKNVLWDDLKKQAFLRVTSLPDFIENSVWELNVPSYIRNNTSIRVGLRANKPMINFTIYYDENTSDGNVIHHLFGGLMMLVRTQLDDGTTITNQRLLNPLLLKIDSLLFDFDEKGNGKQKKNADKIRIVFTGKSRTNGVVRHDMSGNMRPATEAFKIKDEDLETMFVGDGNEVGVVGITSRGNLGRIKPPSQKDRTNIRGMREDRSLRDGLVAISLKMPYTEDKGARQNSPIIPFTSKFFTKNDAIFIVELLANYGKFLNQGLKIKVNGKEYDSPISAHDLLYNLMLRFHGGAETDNNFVLDFAKKDDGSQDFTRVIATEWGTGKIIPQPFDLRDRDGKNALYKHLLAGASMWYQNERLMLMGTTQKLDNTPNNPFLGVEQFFKNNPDVDQIVYTDSLVFDRKDFDPDGDGSFKGIHGFTWMMRHGWMQSTFSDIIAPLMSATDAEVIEEEITPEVDDAPFISPTPEHEAPKSGEYVRKEYPEYPTKDNVLKKIQDAIDFIKPNEEELALAKSGFYKRHGKYVKADLREGSTIRGVYEELDSKLRYLKQTKAQDAEYAKQAEGMKSLGDDLARSGVFTESFRRMVMQYIAWLYNELEKEPIKPTDVQDRTIETIPDADEIAKELQALAEQGFSIDLGLAAQVSDDLYESLRNGELDKLQRYVAFNPINREQAERRLKRILGKNFPVRFTPYFVEMFANGDNSVGRLNKRGIILSEYAENGVEFHEAFHAVVEILLPEVARKRLYKHYIEQYAHGHKVSDRVIAEGLADLYYDFKMNTPEVKFTWNIMKLFKNVYEYGKALAGLNDFRIALMFAATDAGLMRAFSVNPKRLADIDKRFGRGLDFTVKDSNNKDHVLKQFANFKQINDLADVLVYKLIDKAGIDLLGKNLWQLDTRLGAILTMVLATPEEKKAMQDKYEKLQSKMGTSAWDEVPHSKEYKHLTLEGISDEVIDKALQSGKLSPLAARNARLFREAFDNWDLFRPIIEKKIAAFGVDKKVERERRAVEDMDGGEGHNQEEFGHYEQPFYEHSIREDVPTKIRYFLSTIPNRKFADYDDVASGRVASIYFINKNGERERMYLDVKNNSMGYATYMPYNKVYNTLLRLCHSARDILEMDDMMNQLGKTDYITYRVGKAFHRFRDLMYKRWTKDDFDGQYLHKPKVLIRESSGLSTVKKDGMVMLHPSEYTADQFATVVRYANDVVSPTGELLHKQGDVIKEAVILTDPDYEQLVVQLFQAVHAQRLNFQHIYSVAEVDSKGKLTGRFSYDQQSTSQDYDTQLYPRLWFNTLRSGFGGIFNVSEDGSISVATKEDGSPITVFADVAKSLRNIRTAISSDSGALNVHKVPVRNVYKDLYNDDDFSEIEIEFVRLLNQVGVQMDVSTLNYMLLVKYPRTNIVEAFRRIFTSTDVDSIEPFIEKDGVLDKLQKALNTNNFSLFFEDKKAIKNELKPELSVDASGFTIYGDNGFLNDLAKWVGQYRLANRDAMQIGPNNTKLYTYAQHHSASEGVIQLNHVFDDNGNEVDHGLMHDLKQSPYVISETGEGSIIARSVLDPNFNPTHDRVKLATFEGVRLNTASTGGTKYSEITSREDWLSKAVILQNGNIIFPTLSDKSTWFYLLGFTLPGINYNNVDIRQLPKFSNTKYSRIFFNRTQFNTKSQQQYFGDLNDVIDQLILYAYRELALVNQTMNQLGILSVNQTDHHLEENEKIANFHKGTINGARFAFLTGVYGKYTEHTDSEGNVVDFTLDENVDEFYEFNKYDPANPEKSVLDSRERAMRVFFDKRPNETDEQLKARQRSMIANILQHRVKDQLDDLVEKGIIKKLDRVLAKHYRDARGNAQYNNDISDFFGFKNVFLDHKAIDLLKSKYEEVAVGNGTYKSMYSPQQLESAAIVAYVYDITAKSIMSKEETQRIFTGFPHFFKWKFDEETGSLVNIIEDESKRHGGEGSTGTSNITDLPNITGTYRCAEIEDYKITSPIIKSLLRVFKDNEYRDALIDILSEEYLNEVNSLTRSRYNTFDIKSALLYSGKAPGADTEWAAAARELGIKVEEIVNQDYDNLSIEEKKKIEKEYTEVAARLHRDKFDSETDSGKYVRRDMMQADNADAIFAVGNYDISKKQVSGGTAYAVTRGLIRGIPVYFYELNEKQWYDLSSGTRIDAPTLTTHAAVIGTRKIKESGIEAIKDVLSQTLNRKGESTKYQNIDEFIDSIYDEAYNMPFYLVEKKLAEYKGGIYKSIVDRKVEAAVESFSNNDIDVTDGTAYITDKMAENLLRMRGAWNSDVAEAFLYLRGEKKPKKGTYLSNSKAYKTVMDALIGTQKYSAFGHRMQHGVPVHFYNKYALFPIFKGLSYGFTSELYKKMNDPEYGIDMLMVKQAVKVGQLGGQFFGPSMTEEDLKNFSFKGLIYEQEYSMVRRQLNTDPHERDLMAMGTQAAKVALSVIQDNQTYTLSNGEVVRGREIKERIMNAIKELSGIGVNKVNEKFFDDIVRDESGKIVSKKLNPEKFADFIENELLNRNADKNILDSVRELRLTGAPVLNSVTNMQWIESILISFINKNVIDINLPGNAFYQRSVFGMEGIVGDNQFPVLANGKRLQMINEEGSMDAVVSLDFFYNILPSHLKYDFDKAKQWLIDNNIISGVKSFDTEWHNATANIVAYRIPTQAVSSIHALRIVDVIPIVRDTIVLPEEFTKITGSDFDIDKLYCSMIQYNVTKTVLNGNVTYEKSSVEYDATSHFNKDENPEQYWQNELMNMYLSLLKDAGKKVSLEETDERVMLGKYAHLLHRPIDNDTDLVKNVLKRIEAGQKKKPVESFEAGSLYTQSNLKSNLSVAKFGIGPFALNNNNHILTRLYNVSFKSTPNSIITLLGAESLHRDKDRDGNSIMSWISAFINAHVDVAKDPYILRLNVNKYTYNLVSLLIRTGFGKDALYFTAQPILKKLAEEYSNINGDIVDDPSISPAERWKEAEKELALSVDYGNDRITKKINKLYGRGNAKYTSEDFNEDSEIFKTLFGITDDGYKAGSLTLLEKLLTDKNYRIDLDKAATVENLKTDEIIKIGNVMYSPRELQGFIFIAKRLFDDYSDALSTLVLTTKIDTKKHGISFLEQRQYMKRYEELCDYSTNLFDSNLLNMLQDSFIDYKTRAAIPLLKEILGPQMIHFTDQFLSINDKLQDITNNRSNDTRRAIQNAMLAYVKQKVMNRIMEQQDVDFDQIIRGRNSLANRIQALKNKILSLSKPEYSFYASNGVITNTLLANLHAVPYILEYGLSTYLFLLLDNSADDDADIENEYIDAFELMWQSEDDEIKGIARDLAIYAFMTSADNRGLNKFFKYVPFSLRKDIGYVDGMNTMYRMFASGQMLLSPEGFDINTINVNEFYKNNWRNAKIIPLYKPKKALVGHKMLYDDVNKQNGQIIKRDSYLIFADYSVRGVNRNTGTYTPYIKMRRPYASTKDADPYLLYRLIGVGKEGRDEFPIYALTDSKGVAVRTGTDIYELYEYERDDQNKHVTTGHRLDDVNWDTIVKDLTAKVANYVKQYPRYDERTIATGTIEKQYSYNPVSPNQPMTKTIIGTDSEGNQTFTQAQPFEYRLILRQMYQKEKDIQRIESALGQLSNISLRWSDVFKKFCKAA